MSFVERRGDVVVEGEGAVGKRGVDAARLQPRVGGGVVFAAGDEDGAQPGFVVALAVLARACERVLGFAGGVAGNLSEGVFKVVVVVGGLGVIDEAEASVVEFEVGGGGDGVGDGVAEFEVEEDLAGVV